MTQISEFPVLSDSVLILRFETRNTEIRSIPERNRLQAFNVFQDFISYGHQKVLPRITVSEDW